MSSTLVTTFELFKHNARHAITLAQAIGKTSPTLNTHAYETMQKMLDLTETSVKAIDEKSIPVLSTTAVQINKNGHLLQVIFNMNIVLENNKQDTVINEYTDQLHELVLDSSKDSFLLRQDSFEYIDFVYDNTNGIELIICVNEPKPHKS